MNEAIRPTRNVELGASAEEFQNLHEFVRKARANLNQNAWDYIVGAAETETTMRRNRMALDEIAFRPRVLRNVAKVDASVELFGRKLRLPVMLAPVGALELFDPGAGAAVARGAGTFGAAHMLSSVTEPGLEKTAEAAPDALRIYQLYVRGGDDFVEDCVSSSITAAAPCRCCRKFWAPSPAAPRSWSTARSAAAPISSRPSPWGPTSSASAACNAGRWRRRAKPACCGCWSCSKTK